CTSRLVCGLLVSSRPRRYPCLLSVTPPCLDRRIPTVSDPPSWPARPDSWERSTPGYAVVHQAIDRRCGRHRVLEDRLPTRKRQVARQHHAPPFIALRQKGEQHLHLFSTVLDISNIVENHHVILRNLFEKTAKLQVTLRGQEVLNHQTAGREHHLPSRADQFLANRARDMRFPRAGVPENEHILMSLYEASFQQGPDLLSRFKSRVD